MRIRRTRKEPLIQLIEFFLRDLLVIKYFDDPLSVHPLFHKSRDVCQIKLLTDEILSAVSCYHFRYQDHHKDHEHGKRCQDRTQDQHGDKCNYNRECRHEYLRDRLVDHLTQCIRIICVETHDRAIRILIEITDRKRLHVFKHLITDTLKYALADHNHHTAVDECGDHAQKEDGTQECQRLIEFCIVRILLADQRDDKVIQKKLQ